MYPAEPALLYDPIRYAMEGGKRLRSEMTLRAAELWMDSADDPRGTVIPSERSDEGSLRVRYELRASALAAAEALEMFHNFTLLHDDIMDNAPLRRGAPSVFARWGVNVAVLSGDALMILAYRRLGGVRADLLPRVLSFFNEAAIRVCEGQQMDMDFEAAEEVSAADYLAMVERKTAALFVGAVSMGGAIGGASERDLELLREFGLQFGVAFQMQDDLLDAYGDARLGKARGGDIVERKKTFLAVQVPSAELTAAAGDVERVIAIYNRYGVRERVEAEIERRFAAALTALDGLSARRERVKRFRAFAIAQLGRHQ